jgi:hypothetical protein
LDTTRSATWLAPVIHGVTAAVALVLLALLASRAEAESSVLRRPALHWTRGDDALGCVDPRTLSEHVESLVGPVLVRASEAENSIEGRVESIAGGKLRVRVRIVDRSGAKVGERTFEQATTHCAELTPAIVFVIGMVIDPDVAAHGLPPALVAMIAGGERPPEQVLLEELDDGPVLVAHPDPTVREVQPTRADPRQPKPRAPDRRQASALLRGSYGEVPRALLSLDLRFLHSLPRHLSVLGYLRGGIQLGPHELEENRSLDMGTFDLGLALCGGHAADRDLRLIGCLGAELASALAHAHGLAVNKLDIASVPAAVAQLTLRWRWRGSLGLVAMINGRLAAFERDIFYRDGEHNRVPLVTLHKLSFGLALGPSFEF